MNFKQFFEETTGQIFKPKRNVPQKFDASKHPEIAEEIFNLISTAYNRLGGHAKIRTPNDLVNNPKLTYWQGTDIHDTEDFDVILFGKDTIHGVKLTGGGHDGVDNSKRLFIQQFAEKLQTSGHYAEVSGKLADIMINKYKVPIVKDYDVVEKLLKNKKITPLRDGVYSRQIGGREHEKIIVGKPKV